MNDLDFIPEPYRGMIQTTAPDDIYLVYSIVNGEPIQVRRIPADIKASAAHDIERSMPRQPDTEVHKFKGRDLRTLILEIARAHDRILGAAVVANPFSV